LKGLGNTGSFDVIIELSTTGALMLDMTIKLTGDEAEALLHTVRDKCEDAECYLKAGEGTAEEVAFWQAIELKLMQQ
jgi:hypothetical protein